MIMKFQTLWFRDSKVLTPPRDRHTRWRVSMGLTDRRKTAKNLVDSRKN